MKQVIAVALGCAALFAGAAIGSSQTTSSPEVATAQSPKQVRAMLRQLRQINRGIGNVNRAIGTTNQGLGAIGTTLGQMNRTLGGTGDSRFSSSVVGLLRASIHETGETNSRLGAGTFDTRSVLWLLDRICRHVNESFGC